ncbi:MAG: hypothetical protein H5U15_00370 [Roseovarius sp.]|nr:hypothetical protein [Roseovarius sp.]
MSYYAWGRARRPGPSARGDYRGDYRGDDADRDAETLAAMDNATRNAARFGYGFRAAGSDRMSFHLWPGPRACANLCPVDPAGRSAP